jgi:hypothetical protein
VSEKLLRALDLLNEVNEEMNPDLSAWDYLQNAMTQLDHTINVLDQES